MQNQPLELLSIVVSVYNEQDALELFEKTISTILKDLPYKTEVLFVNDGSVDNSKTILNVLASKNKNIRVLHFSRNFGHEAAMIAGIDKAKGDAIICMDSDCQHPPACIPEMVETYLKGYDSISMVRTSRSDGKGLNKLSSKLFYKLLNKISPVNFHENASDFFLVSKAVASVLKNDFRERTRFLRGIIQIVGFNNTTLEYKAEDRLAGESKYSFYKLLVLSMSAIVSFSKIPLHLGLIAGIVFSFISGGVSLYSFVMYLYGDVPPGYTTLVIFISFSFALMFFLIGIIGVYIGYLFEESKQRPIYIIEEEK